MNRPRVLLADNHPMFLAVLRTLVEAECEVVRMAVYRPIGEVLSSPRRKTWRHGRHVVPDLGRSRTASTHYPAAVFSLDALNLLVPGSCWPELNGGLRGAGESRAVRPARSIRRDRDRGLRCGVMEMRHRSSVGRAAVL